MLYKIKELQLGTLIEIEGTQYIKDLNIKKLKHIGTTLTQKKN